MGLTYYFKFSAPAEIDTAILSTFLLSVEDEAKRMGFNPTIVVDAPFDTDERRNFARRLTTGMAVEDLRLKNVRLRKTPHVVSHDPITGSCRITPEHGILLVLTDERGIEGAFGFFRYPSTIYDDTGRKIMPTPSGSSWIFSDFIKTADPRYRAIVRRFAEAGYLVTEQDDYFPAGHAVE